MLTILGLSDKACFICQKRDGTAEVRFKDGTFSGVLCMTHTWERLRKPEPKSKTETKKAAG